jgi:FkbM family methyltransferase
MKEFIKKLIKLIPIAFTKNQKYDKQTKKVIQQVCKSDSNCIDVGCHKGEVLDIIIRFAPAGRHFGFEPLPDMYSRLKSKYTSSLITISDIALSNTTGHSTFNYVISNPAYSGLVKRTYDRPDEKDTSITVTVDKLDNIIPPDVKIDLIKIDVEGGELQVLEGGKETISRSKPVIIFEHGIGGSDCYGTTPDSVYQLLADCGLKVSVMERWLNNQNAFTLNEFKDQFYQKLNYYFIAYP